MSPDKNKEQIDVDVIEVTQKIFFLIFFLEHIVFAFMNHSFYQS